MEQIKQTPQFLSNIKVHYFFTAFKSIDTTQGIWALYLASKGLSLFEIGIIEGIFHITSLLMETPTGVIADLFGRKMSRLIGVIFIILSNIVIIFSNQFIFFALAFALSALSYNFESGADEAIIYDSLKHHQKEKKYMKIAGNTEIIFQTASVIGLLIGGFIGNIKYQNVYYISILLSIFTLIIGFFFKEPKNDAEIKPQSQKFHHMITNQYKISINAIKNNSRLGYLMFLTSFLFATATVAFYYLQLAWEKTGSSPLIIGIYLAAGSVMAAIAAFFADRIDKKVGSKIILKFSPFIFAASLIWMFHIPSAYLPFCLISFFEAIIFVASRDYLNQLIKSEQRATILSFASVIYSLVMIIIFPLFGYLSEWIQIKNTFLVLGGIVLLLSILNLKSKENQ